MPQQYCLVYDVDWLQVLDCKSNSIDPVTSGRKALAAGSLRSKEHIDASFSDHSVSTC